MKSDRNDLTTGSVLRKFVLFALPIVAMNLLQAIYNLADMIILGRFVGAEAMSAVSIGGQVTTLVLVISMGLSNGTAVYVGQLTGAGRADEAPKYVGTMLSFLTLAALAVTAAVIALRMPLLHALKTPEESFSRTASYLAVCMAGTVFIYIYNVLSAALRGAGESVLPMVIVAVTSVVNILLDLLFVAGLKMDAPGAALATILSQFLSALLTAIAVKRRSKVFDFRWDSLRIRGGILKEQLAVGMPQAIQFTCTNISFLFIMALVNAYGVAASAAAGAAIKIGSFGLLPGQACMAALVTATAQNLPKKNYRRILQSLLYGCVISAGISTVLICFCEFMPVRVYGLFTNNAAVAAAGTGYLRLYAISFFVEVVMFCMFGVLTGAGYTPVTMAAAIGQAFLVRLALAWVFSRCTPLGFAGIGLAYTLAPLVGITVSAVFLLSGRWKRSIVAEEYADVRKRA